jgi:DNA-binding response OmpR family regulator
VYEIMVVEDQPDIRGILKKYLQREGFGCHLAADGFEALEIFSGIPIHLVILDIMLPGIDGYEVLEKIREISEVPVIMLTAKLEEADRLKGFGTGADDYVVKPFSIKELIMRVKAIIKRVYDEAEDIVCRYDDLTLFQNSMKLIRGNEQIDITTAEFRLLLVFFRNQGIVLSREQLIGAAFGNEYEGYDRNIDSYIKRIRQKIEADPGEPKILLTKYGAGYTFGGQK